MTESRSNFGSASDLPTDEESRANPGPQLHGKSFSEVQARLYSQQSGNEEELCVQQIQALQTEIRYAMSAISRNKQKALTESLSRQELLCDTLKYLLKSLSPQAASGLVPRRHATLLTALTSLRQLNCAYAEALHQVQLSNGMLLTLRRSYGSAGGRHCPLLPDNKQHLYKA